VIATLFANASEPWPLRAGVVHVWRFECRQDPGRLAAALSDDEQAAARRFATAELRDAYIVQHAMTRGLLARYVDAEPGTLRFSRGARGKPMLESVHHNLSHAEDVALLAVTHDAPLGVDVERFAAPLDLAALIPLVLAPAEAACIDRRAFLRVWCRKEACLKATGIGLLDDLTAVSAIADRVVIAGIAMHVQDLAIGDAHAAALSIVGAELAPVGAAPVGDFTS
jgi:4'-phosphopantetheinyl transferase